MNAKAKAQTLHAQLRIGERLGICVTKGDLEQWARDIRAHKYPMRQKQSNRRYLYEATVAGRSVLLVFDNQRGTVVTVLFDGEVDNVPKKGSDPYTREWLSDNQQDWAA